jgi:hypothetical protein
MGRLLPLHTFPALRELPPTVADPLVSGPAAGEGGVGDSIVPLEAAHLPGSGVQRITLEEATHSIGSPDSWYGSDAVVDNWLPQAQQAVAKSGGGLSGFQQIKKFGAAGTLAYILTELAFWVVAFPVAFTTYYQTLHLCRRKHCPPCGAAPARRGVCPGAMGR